MQEMRARTTTTHGLSLVRFDGTPKNEGARTLNAPSPRGATPGEGAPYLRGMRQCACESETLSPLMKGFLWRYFCPFNDGLDVG